MGKIKLPKQLKDLLDGSEIQAPLQILTDRVGEILADNKLPFFPDYTDHGVEHINRVLGSVVDLVPPTVWERSTPESKPRLLCDADATVIVGGVLLHDFAMHLRHRGFLDLVGKESRFRPLPWFKERQAGRDADRSWDDLWDEFVREARKFDDRSLGNIIGTEAVREGWKFEELPTSTGEWQRNHCLVIGEFVRRHHARLAHEIAIYGFPGVSVGSGEGQFPAMGSETGHVLGLADLVGLTARSHGMSLRTCQAYLEWNSQYAKQPRPMGTAIFYAMALLRVADYLQIDRQRAPAVLLQLRHPQSPISVKEWAKHLAVDSMGPAADPRGIMVTVSPKVSLELFLQLRDLLTGLQQEMDQSTAVLDEIYGNWGDLGLNQLSLSRRRVHSNLENRSFLESLPYVPERTGFSADPHLLTLIVEPLYGAYPEVGVRELMQNAVDAVRELGAWCEARSVPVDSCRLPEQNCDVLLEFMKREDGTWYLRVTDKGIGMTGETIQNFFLRAGASFRLSPDWIGEFTDRAGRPRVTRSGRFGVGAFAIFLLGPSFRLSTRHVGAKSEMGCSIEGRADSTLLEIRRAHGLPIGTTVEVDVSPESVKALGLESALSGDRPLDQFDGFDWFAWDWPRVVRRVSDGSRSVDLVQQFAAPLHQHGDPSQWSMLHPPGFDAVLWTFGDAPLLVCNGLRIAQPLDPMDAQQDATKELSDVALRWRSRDFEGPPVAVMDSAGNLPLTLQRYWLSQSLPFMDELTRDVMLSFIAHALVLIPCGEGPSGIGRVRHPLCRDTSIATQDPSRSTSGLLRWCFTESHCVPVDSWLHCLLDTNVYAIVGIIADTGLIPGGLQLPSPGTHVSLRWDMRRERLKAETTAFVTFTELVGRGVPSLGLRAIGGRVLVSSLRGKTSPATSLAAWRRLSGRRRETFCLESGEAQPMLPLEDLLDAVAREATKFGFFSFAYAAEIRGVPRYRRPNTQLSEVWSECLGKSAIPFDSNQRKELIDKGRKHPELRRHIDAWEAMMRDRSTWVLDSMPMPAHGPGV